MSRRKQQAIRLVGKAQTAYYTPSEWEMRRVVMVVDRARIERLEKELNEARKELWREDAERYRILTREMTSADKERIISSLTDRGECVLFGLEAPEEPKKRGVSQRPGGAGGDLTCSICGKGGFTKRGLGLVRLHKSEMEKEGSLSAGSDEAA